jgi:hypothetical protein
MNPPAKKPAIKISIQLINATPFCDLMLFRIVFIRNFPQIPERL